MNFDMCSLPTLVRCVRILTSVLPLMQICFSSLKKGRKRNDGHTKIHRVTAHLHYLPPVVPMPIVDLNVS